MATERDARWDRLQELFRAALQVSPQEQRDYVAGASADDEDLGDQLGRLLAAHNAENDSVAETLDSGSRSRTAGSEAFFRRRDTSLSVPAELKAVAAK